MWDVSSRTCFIWVVVADVGIQNRVTAHSATLDWSNGQRRHLARITPQAERPEETPFSASQENGVERNGTAHKEHNG